MNERPLAAVCAACGEDLPAWLDGELDERRARDVSRHVEACARCRSRSEELHAVDGAMRALADAPLSSSEVARLERVRARLATALREERDADMTRDRPALVAASDAGSRTAAPPRRRRLLTKSLAAVAAFALGVLVVPGLLERATSRAPGPGDRLAPRAEGVASEDRVARRAAESIERAPSAAAPRPEPLTPGHLGASAAEDPIAGSGEDGVLLPLELDAADLPLVERLDALEALPRVGELSSEERALLAERLDPLRAEATADRERLRRNEARWRATAPQQREALRQRWRSFQALTAAERDRLLGGESRAR